MLKPIFVLGMVLALAGCETLLASRAPTLPAAATAPRAAAGMSGPIDLGDWRTASAAAVLQRFSSHILNRWPVGAPIARAAADLSTAGFSCAPPRRRGTESPDQSCRRQVRERECTHIWTVTLYDDAGAVNVSRVRALYDRRCGDGLAGGPD